MIPSSTFIACFITLFLSLVLPILVLIVMGIKNKGKGIWSAWFLGAAGFFISQIVVRLPLLNILSGMASFQSFAREHYFLYALLLAFTAGLFELAGRFAAAKFLGKNRTFRRSLAAGLGHGGIESIVLVGLTYINNLVYLFLIQFGAFDAMIAQTEAMGVDSAQLIAVRDTLLQVSAPLFLAAGVERVLTMVSHAAMSVIVCYGVAVKRTLPWMLLCLGMHTLLDTTVAATGFFSQNIAYGIIYTCMTVMALVSIWILRKLSQRWPETTAEPAPAVEGGSI